MAFATEAKDILMSRWAIEQTRSGNSSLIKTSDIQKDIIEEGNIDLLNRPVYKTPDGGIATVNSMSFEEDGVHVLVPTVLDANTIMSGEQAYQHYRNTGQHLGKFKTQKSSDIFAQRLHEQQEKYYTKP